MEMEGVSYKKKLCTNFINQGACHSGSDCTFAHGNRELRSFENPIYKAQLCTAFEQAGQCAMGYDCLFAHGEAELRTDDVPLSGADSGPQEHNSNYSKVAPVPKAANGEMKKGAYKSALCIHFMKHASCHLGPACTFAHGKEELTNVSAPDTSDPKYKTKLCLRYEQDHFCPNGEFCVFAHGESELRSQGNSAAKKSPLYKTNLCHNFTTLGVCPSGKNCSFAHGRYELRPVGFDGDFEAKIAENPKWKCVLCKIFLGCGHCNRANCDYAHGELELRSEFPDAPKVIRPNYKTVLCNNYMARGFCFHEDACTFAHGESELNSGKDAASALKLIRDTNMMRKRPKEGMTQSSMAGGMGMGGMPAGMAPFNSASPSYHEQKLFAEFLEFKKMKQHTDVTVAGTVSYHYNMNQGHMRAPTGMAGLTGGYEPLKVMNGATGHSMPVTELVASSHQHQHSPQGYYQAAAVASMAHQHPGGSYHDDLSRPGVKREPLRSRYLSNSSAGMKFDRSKMYNRGGMNGLEHEYTY